jgi:catechol 2,3-dioxygenase-like lactoylglutathione lyase family enzyme
MAGRSKLLRMDNVLIVVDDLEASKAFLVELGMVRIRGFVFLGGDPRAALGDSLCPGL